MALTGCGKKLDTESIEPQIEKIEQTASAKVESVKCPDDVTAKKGDKFECTVTFVNGKKLNVPVTQTDAEGHVKFEAVPPNRAR